MRATPGAHVSSGVDSPLAIRRRKLSRVGGLMAVACIFLSLIHLMGSQGLTEAVHLNSGMLSVL